MRNYILIIVLIAVLALTLAPLALAQAFDLSHAKYPSSTPVLFENGSFVVGDYAGCLPWAICSVEYAGQ